MNAVKLTRNQAYRVIRALENDWVDLEDYEYDIPEVQKLKKEMNNESRKNNKALQRIIDKIKGQLNG